jgi:hypothetical protein
LVLASENDAQDQPPLNDRDCSQFLWLGCPEMKQVAAALTRTLPCVDRRKALILY